MIDMTVKFELLNNLLANEFRIQTSLVTSKYFVDETDPRICVNIRENIQNIDTNVLNKYSEDITEVNENYFTFMLNTGNPEFHYEFKKRGIIY